MEITQREVWKLWTSDDGYWMHYAEDMTREKLGLNSSVRFEDIIFTDKQSAVEIASMILKEYPLNHNDLSMFENEADKKSAIKEVGAHSASDADVKLENRVKGSFIVFNEKENKVDLVEELEVCLKRTVSVTKNVSVEGETYSRVDKEIRESSWYPAVDRSKGFWVFKTVQTVIGQ